MQNMEKFSPIIILGFLLFLQTRKISHQLPTFYPCRYFPHLEKLNTTQNACAYSANEQVLQIFLAVK